jgi:hypothetical protein
MTEVVGQNPYNLANLLKGPCRVLYAPLKQAIPTKIKDIITPEGEYKPAGEWKDFGATTSAAAYGRQFQTTGYQIEQATGDVEEDVTSVIRSIQGTFAEITPELLQMLEQAKTIGTVAKGSGYSAEKQVKVGTVESLESYRVAFLGRRSKGQGVDVTQKDGNVRGAFVVYCMYRGKLTGDQAALQLARGQLASAPLAFQAYPESGQAEGTEHGLWMVEQSGTIE